MKFLIEKSKYYKVDDVIYIEYWYNKMITEVKIVEIIGKKYKVSHNTKDSKIQNAPDEMIKSSNIISKKEMRN